MEKHSIAVLGCGDRGCAYAVEFKKHCPDIELKAFCDVKTSSLTRIQTLTETADAEIFTDVDEFFQKKRSDALVIATPDREHVSHAVRAMEAGYDVLLEKPISDSAEELEKLLTVQKKTNRRVVVCHVLRYAPGFKKCAEILDSGLLGDLYAIDASERVAYWHWAQAYVRGIGGSVKRGHPVILAKCCHDLDLIQSFAKSRCRTVSSIGDLRFFKPENAPESSSDRCLDCQYADSCVYSAKKIYLDKWHEQGEPAFSWPFNKISDIIPNTEESLTKGLKDGVYGRCVFQCHVEQVDHQFVQMEFVNGVKASLKMVYAEEPGRRMTFYCQYGELIFDERDEKIEVRPFGGKTEIIPFSMIIERGRTHGGGDKCISLEFADMLRGKTECKTSLEESVESHLIGIYAEQSRQSGGKQIIIPRS